LANCRLKLDHEAARLLITDEIGVNFGIGGGGIAYCRYVSVIFVDVEIDDNLT
jgi:hypothetical protein